MDDVVILKIAKYVGFKLKCDWREILYEVFLSLEHAVSTNLPRSMWFNRARLDVLKLRQREKNKRINQSLPLYDSGCRFGRDSDIGAYTLLECWHDFKDIRDRVKLTHSDRLVLYLLYVEELTVSEIAETLQSTNNNVNQRLFVCRSKLKIELDKFRIM